MKIVEVTERIELSSLLAELDGVEGELVIARNGLPVARLSRIPSVLRTPGVLADSPAWRDFVYDPAVFAPLETDEQLAAEGWPI